MRRLLVPGLVLALLTAAPVVAEEITNEAKCRSEIETIKSLDEDSDVGPKYEPVVKDLIEALEHLCRHKDFDAAENVAGAIRTILTHRVTG